MSTAMLKVTRTKVLIPATAIVAAVYFVAGKLGLMLAFVHASATAVWPPTGIALAALLLLGYRVWPGILLGAFLVNLTTSGSVASSIGITVGNTLEGLLAARLVNTFASGPRAFDRLPDVFKFAFLAAIVSTAVSASFGVTSLCLTGNARWSDFLPIWLTWWLGDAGGALVVAPVLILWGTSPPGLGNRRRALEAATLLLFVVLIGLVVFAGLHQFSAKDYPFEFLTFPVLVWAAFRFGPRETATAIFLISGIAVWSTLRGFGPFTMDTPNESLLLLQVFMGVAAVMSLALAAAVLERQYAKGEAEAERARVEAVLRQMPAGVMIAEAPSGRLLLWNEQVERISRRPGRAATEVGEYALYQGFHPDGRPYAAEEWPLARAILAGEVVDGEEIALVRGDGTQGTTRVSAAPIRDRAGRIVAGVAILYDVTEQKRTEKALRAERERLELAQMAGHIGTFEWDIVTNEVRWTEQLEALYGLPSGGFGGRYESWANALHPDDRERAEREVQKAAATGTDLDTQFRVVWPDGSVRHLAAMGRVIRDERGTSVRMVGVNVDVSEREAARERLAFLAEASRVLASSLDYESTLGSVARLAVPRFADWCVVHLLESDGQLRPLAVAHQDPARDEWAREVQQRYPPDPNAPRGIYRVLRTGQTELYPEVTDAMLQAGARDAEHLAVLRALRMRSVMVIPLVARGRTLGAMSFVAAESSRRYGEADLALAEELARVCALAIDNARLYRDIQSAVSARDQFLSVASHELRNPVAGLKATAQLLQRAWDRGTLDSERLERSLKSFTVGSDRLARLTDDLLDVARVRTGRMELRPHRLDVASFLREVVDRNRAHLTAGHTLELDVREGCELAADPDRLEQVIANLVTNAVKYAPEGGPIRVAARPDAAGVRIEVCDPGIGLPPGTESTIFEPFGRAENAAARQIPGMGLGLHICRAIVESHGGRIWAESPGEGQGTCMRVWLPYVAAAPAVGRDAADA